MNHQKITTYKICPYLGLLLSGILFLFSFSRFYIHFKEFENLDESFAYLFYSDPSSAQGLAKKCQIQGIDCETLSIDQEESLQSEELPLSLSISIVRGMKILDYGKTVQLFQDSDVRIDTVLLRWLVYLISALLFLGILALFFTYFKKFCKARWTYFFGLPLLLCYLKLEIFADTARFPVWVLPGKWSDLEGFQALWENLLDQLSAISYFRDYPILCRYYQGLTGCPFYLVLCLLSLWVFLKNALFHLIDKFMICSSHSISYISCRSRKGRDHWDISSFPGQPRGIGFS